jgi:hypothetical protein
LALDSRRRAQRRHAPGPSTASAAQRSTAVPVDDHEVVGIVPAALARWRHSTLSPTGDRYPPPIRRITNVIALTVALYGFAAWAYVAAVALAQPNTLPWQLTHLAKWPRTDTFGELSFVVSCVAFVVYGLTRER